MYRVPLGLIQLYYVGLGWIILEYVVLSCTILYITLYGEKLGGNDTVRYIENTITTYK